MSAPTPAEVPWLMHPAAPAVLTLLLLLPGPAAPAGLLGMLATVAVRPVEFAATDLILLVGAILPPEAPKGPYTLKLWDGSGRTVTLGNITFP